MPTLDGDEELTIPAGTQTGDSFVLRGKGVPYLQRSGRGDQIVLVRVLTPTKLSPKQRELLRELGKTLGSEEIQEPSKGLLDRIKDALGVA